MTLNPEKAALRKHLLEKRDSTSFDLMEIHSEKILSKLMKTKVISEAESIACYYSIGSEVQTVELITRLLEEKKSVSLPRISSNAMSFRIIDDLSKLDSITTDKIWKCIDESEEYKVKLEQFHNNLTWLRIKNSLNEAN